MGPCDHYNGINVAKRRAEMAERVAEGETIHAAGKKMGLTKGQTSRVWQGVVKDMGAQAV